MKTVLITFAFLVLIALSGSAYNAQNFGGDFGRSWLQQHGAMPSTANANNSLWNWGSAPKGYTVSNGNLYSTVYGPEWYYPDFMTNSTPIVINGTSVNNANYISPNFMYEDPWILAQITGQPVIVINNPTGPFI